MNIAITGGLGFIGSNLAIELSKQGANIEIYDINIHKNEKVIRELSKLKNVNINYVDINSHEFKKPVDYIFNLACPASPPVRRHCDFHCGTHCLHPLLLFTCSTSYKEVDLSAPPHGFFIQSIMIFKLL